LRETWRHVEAEHDALPSETGQNGMITKPQTHRQDDNCLAEEAEGDGVAKCVKIF